MGRLNRNFVTTARDHYVTPARAVPPLLPHLPPATRYIEPCAGTGAIVQHLALQGHTCLAAIDIEPLSNYVDKLDAMHLRLVDVLQAQMFITNLPWSWPNFPQLAEHLMAMRPLWTLAPARFLFAERSAKILDHCSDIVCVPRLRWFPDTNDNSTEDTVWLRFSLTHKGGPIFHPKTNSSRLTLVGSSG